MNLKAHVLAALHEHLEKLESWLEQHANAGRPVGE